MSLMTGWLDLAWLLSATSAAGPRVQQDRRHTAQPAGMRSRPPVHGAPGSVGCVFPGGVVQEVMPADSMNSLSVRCTARGLAAWQG
jgi:hypothetical protein